MQQKNSIEQIEVSVFCLCYNHEKFIRDCLDGFVMQETSFKFEVLVHDDASTDNSAKVIKEYEEKYSDIIKPIYQTENQYSKGSGIIKNILFPKAQGNYIAICEGDDYWTDKHKLQMQFDIMQKHGECVASFHIVKRVRYDNNMFHGYISKEYFNPGIVKGSRIISTLLAKIGIVLHISSLFFHKALYYEYFKVSEKYFNFPYTDDLSLNLFLAWKGDFYFIDKSMSSYRVGVPNSWSLRERAGKATSIEQNKTKIESLNNFNRLTYNKYKDEIIFSQNRYKERIAYQRYLKILDNEHKIINYFKYRNELKNIGWKRKFYIVLSRYYPDILNKYLKIKKKVKG